MLNEEVKIVARYIHGSSDSMDEDVVYVVERLPESVEACKEFCCAPERADENVNMCEIEDGHVVRVFKGTPDELNNSLFRTYWLHRQESELLVTESVPRNVPLKICRAVRCILSHLSRTEHREEVKAALRGPLGERLDLLLRIDFGKIDFTGEFKNVSGRDALKVIAFQLGQVYGLLECVELFTKREIANEYPVLEDFLYRREYCDVGVLDAFKNDTIRKIAEVCPFEDGVVGGKPAARFGKMVINLINENIIDC